MIPIAVHVVAQDDGLGHEAVPQVDQPQRQCFAGVHGIVTKVFVGDGAILVAQETVGDDLVGVELDLQLHVLGDKFYTGYR